MKNDENNLSLTFVAACLGLALIWIGIPITGLFAAGNNATLTDCPNGPLAAQLMGTGTGAGTARFRERGSNRLIVNVRSINATAGATLTVYIGETSVGTISRGTGGSGQLRLDSLPTGTTIDENTTISVRSGTTVVLSGTFACVAGGLDTSPTASPTVSPTT